MRLPEIYEMMRVKEDERGLPAVKELYERIMAKLDEVAKRHGISIGAVIEEVAS
jgi:V/A-type H+-transporting ATPase subunit A